MRQTLSLHLILLVLLSSAIGSSQNDFESTSNHHKHPSQIVEDSDDAQLEFRESVKMNVDEGNYTHDNNAHHYISLVIFQARHYARFDQYGQSLFAENPSYRKFIALGSIIV